MLLARSSAFLLWALAVGVAVSWGLRFTAPGPTMPADVSVVGADAPRTVDWARLFGADPAAAVAEAPPPPAAASRFQLLGLVAAGVGAPAVALLSVDGSPPRAVRVGGTVDGEWVLQQVTASEVSIGPAGGATVVRLSATALPPPAVGTLPSVPGAAFQAAPGFGLPPPVRGPRPAGAAPAPAPTMAPAPPLGAAPSAGGLPEAFRRAAAGLPTTPQPLPAAVPTEPVRNDRRPPELSR